MRLAGPLRVAAVAGAAALTWLLLTGLLGPGRSQSPIRGLLGPTPEPTQKSPPPFPLGGVSTFPSPQVLSAPRPQADEQRPEQRGARPQHRAGQRRQWGADRGPGLRHVGGRRGGAAEVPAAAARGDVGSRGLVRRPRHKADGGNEANLRGFGQRGRQGFGLPGQLGVRGGQGGAGQESLRAARPEQPQLQ
ncbi:protein FAM3A isoform X2 [Caloenas nicobarica]|uniref:protein FAM3A isoform X2 n=1 Tax=Caloenas nicobarica TaxID=187106 RepID=UPI0032B75B4E